MGAFRICSGAAKQAGIGRLGEENRPFFASHGRTNRERSQANPRPDALSLWNAQLNGIEPSANLLAGAADGGDAKNRDERGKQRVLDQILALLVAHQRNYEIFHNLQFSV
jgi:hypothetical protein